MHAGTHQQHTGKLDRSHLLCLQMLVDLLYLVQSHNYTQCHFYHHSSLCSLLLDYSHLCCIQSVCHCVIAVLYVLHYLLSMLLFDLLMELHYTIVQHLDQDKQ